MKQCRECGSHEGVLHGRCWRCRERAGGTREQRRGTRPRRLSVEPQHDQPWVPTNQLTDRIRRSPRR